VPLSGYLTHDPEDPFVGRGMGVPRREDLPFIVDEAALTEFSALAVAFVPSVPHQGDSCLTAGTARRMLANPTVGAHRPEVTRRPWNVVTLRVVAHLSLDAFVARISVSLRERGPALPLRQVCCTSSMRAGVAGRPSRKGEHRHEVEAQESATSRARARVRAAAAPGGRRDGACPGG
jgi:hypothetical protein